MSSHHSERSKPEVLDVAALASAQMRAARAVEPARRAMLAADAAWRAAATGHEALVAERVAADAGWVYRQAVKVLREADRAYRLACDTAIADARDVGPSVEQEGLFG